jgi:hypothetical protein
MHGVSLEVECTVRDDLLFVTAIVQASEPVALWTALRRVRLDGTWRYDDRDWIFVEVEDDVLHLCKMALPGWEDARYVPGILPPDLRLLEAGTAHVEAIVLPLPVAEKQPLRRQALRAAHEPDAAVAACLPARVAWLALSVGFVPLDASVARQLAPLGAHPGLSTCARSQWLSERQQRLTERVELPQALDVLRYGAIGR